jgi:hypothetical protein
LKSSARKSRESSVTRNVRGERLDPPVDGRQV